MKYESIFARYQDRQEEKERGHDEGRRGLKYGSIFARYQDRQEEKERNQKRMKGRKKVMSSSYRFLRGRSAGSFYLKCGMAGEFY